MERSGPVGAGDAGDVADGAMSLECLQSFTFIKAMMLNRVRELILGHLEGF